MRERERKRRRNREGKREREERKEESRKEERKTEREERERGREIIAHPCNMLSRQQRFRLPKFYYCIVTPQGSIKLIEMLY